MTTMNSQKQRRSLSKLDKAEFANQDDVHYNDQPISF